VVFDVIDPAPAKVMLLAPNPIVSMEATPVKAPPVETFNPEEFNEKESSAALPIVIVLAATPVPIKIDPVLPESKVKLLLPDADLIVRGPESAILLAVNVCVEPLIIIPLIVLVAVAPEITPDKPKEVTPVIAPVVETLKAEEFIEKVSSVALPIVIVLAATPVPISTDPVVPESKVKFELVVVEILPAPAKVSPVAEVVIVSIEDTPVKAPPEVTFNPDEFIEKVSSVALPIVIVLAATSVPIAIVPVPEFIVIGVFAVVFPKVKPPVVVVSIIVFPLADTFNGPAVEPVKVEIPKTYCDPAPLIAAEVSPKLNAVFAAVVKAQFQF